MTLQLAASENVGGLHAAIADRLADEDDARREWLNAMVHGGGRCRYCGAKPSDKVLARSPGVCGHPNCQRKGRRDARANRKIHDNVPATPAKGEDMPKGKRAEPWPCCGSKSFRHMAACDQSGKKAEPATKAPKRETKVPRRETHQPSRAVSDANVDAMEIAELVELRGLVDEELSRRRGELEEQLAAVRGVLGTAA